MIKKSCQVSWARSCRAFRTASRNFLTTRLQVLPKFVEQENLGNFLPKFTTRLTRSRVFFIDSIFFVHDQIFIILLDAEMVGSVEFSRRRRAAAAIVVCSKKKTLKPRRWWARPWLRRRNRHGANNALVKEVALEDSHELRKFQRMVAQDTEIILQRIGPHISEMDTNMRPAIHATERLLLPSILLAYYPAQQYCWI